jgi:hypothetical protein
MPRPRKTANILSSIPPCEVVTKNLPVIDCSAWLTLLVDVAVFLGIQNF